MHEIIFLEKISFDILRNLDLNLIAKKGNIIERCITFLILDSTLFLFAEAAAIWAIWARNLGSEIALLKKPVNQSQRERNF